MLNPSVSELVEKVGSKYTLVVLAAKRARELNEGAIPTIDMTDRNKSVTTAIHEIMEGSIHYQNIEGK